MHNIRKITNDIYYIGCSSRKQQIFEAIYPIDKGISYNSYFELVTIFSISFFEILILPPFPSTPEYKYHKAKFSVVPLEKQSAK